jgi:uncharacterized protein (TIGR00251 family)
MPDFNERESLYNLEYKIKNSKLYIRVKIIPNSGRNFIDSVKNGELIIKIKAVPEKGKANNELIRFLSKEIKTSKSGINIISGQTSRHKYLSLPESSFDFLKKYLTRD